MARGRKITKTAYDYAEELRNKIGNGADRQIEIRIEKSKNKERKSFLEEVLKQLKEAPELMKTEPKKKGRKSSKKEKAVMEEMEKQGMFTIDSVLSVLPEISYGYVSTIAKKKAKIVRKEGRKAIYRIGEGQEGYADYTFHARPINVRGNEHQFVEAENVHKMVTIPKAKHTQLFYYVDYPWFVRVEPSVQVINRYAYWDNDRGVLLDTGLEVIGTKRKDLEDWEKKYIASFE